MKWNSLASTAVAAVLLQVVAAQWSRPGETGNCPSGGLGCLPLRDCPALASLAQRDKLPSKDAVAQLQQAHCGFQGSHPKVCCPRGGPPSTMGMSLGGGGSEGSWSSPSGTPSSSPDSGSGSADTLTGASAAKLRLLPLNVCGPTNADRIIGGQEAQVMELPWMARLGYRRDQFSSELDYNCGGSLISERYVLTAGHCINENTGLVPVSVRLGEQNSATDTDCSFFSGERVCAPPVVDILIERITKHKDYGQNRFQNDIALLRLQQPVTFTDAVKPVCLPIDGDEQRRDLTGKKVMVAGWGRLANRNGAGGSKTLMKVSVPVSRADECSRAYQPLQLPIAAEKQMCAGDVGKDSCNGDSGGPLTVAGTIRESLRIVQHGIVSFGPSHCATVGTPGVYTRVSHYVPWIVSNLEP